MRNKYHSLWRTIIFVLTTGYFLTAAYYYLTKPGIIGGDEGLFIKDLALIHQHGWVEAISKNISIPFMLLAYPFSFFLENYIALRLANVFILVTFLLYIYWTGDFRWKSVYPYFFFYIGAVAFMFFGLNDVLFSVCLAIFFYEVYRASRGESFKFPLAFSTLIIAAFTREVIIIFLPIILLGIYIFYRKGIPRSSKNIIPIALLMGFILLNIPSLKENGTLSYDRKNPPESISATWAQRQYLAQLWVNEGKLKFHQHPSWEQTEEYLNSQGENSLPPTVFAGIFYDFELTIKEFFKDLFWIALYHTRTVGLFLITVLLMSAWDFHKERKWKWCYFAPVAIITMACIFGFIIISYIELRWLASIFLLAILTYAYLEEKNKIPTAIITLNQLFMAVLTIYGGYGFLIKIF